ncbi:hypothetical protein ACFX13_001571 [Malus domestica]
MSELEKMVRPRARGPSCSNRHQQPGRFPVVMQTGAYEENYSYSFGRDSIGGDFVVSAYKDVLSFDLPFQLAG